jgi:hypothetical protein
MIEIYIRQEEVGAHTARRWNKNTELIEVVQMKYCHLETKLKKEDMKKDCKQMFLSNNAKK